MQTIKNPEWTELTTEIHSSVVNLQWNIQEIINKLTNQYIYHIQINLLFIVVIIIIILLFITVQTLHFEREASRGFYYLSI